MVKVIIIAEGDYEHTHEFETPAEVSAFVRGVHAGAGCYGCGSCYAVTREDLGEHGPEIDALIRKHLPEET